ncbi:MAG: DUF4097 family beta strand repeat-containing protein [Pyrinomonadaceae bacterium]
MQTELTEKKRYKVILILLVGLAAFSTTMKDLNHLQEMVAGLQQFKNEWLGDGLTTVTAKNTSTAESWCANEVSQRTASAAEFRWSGRVAPGMAIEIKGINGDISAEPAAGTDVEVVAYKKSARSNPDQVSIKVIEHAGGVTICAIYPSEDPDKPNTCEPDKGGQMSVRNNDVNVDFSVRVPFGVGFVGRTVNGEISASSLAGNVISHTVNGAIKISTSGYAQAKTVNGEISAKIGDSNWPDSLEFKTVNGEISLDLPATTSTEVRADTINGEISSDFPLSMLGKITRKHLSGRIGNGGRSLV